MIRKYGVPVSLVVKYSFEIFIIERVAFNYHFVGFKLLLQWNNSNSKVLFWGLLDLIHLDPIVNKRARLVNCISSVVLIVIRS